MEENVEYIFSHELAAILHITAVQVRRDLMLLGFSSVYRKGYPVKKLIEVIGQRLDSESGQNVAIIGMGNLGTALASYLTGLRPKLRIVALFDIDENKKGLKIGGVKCYHVSEMGKVIKSKKISIGVVTVPQTSAKKVASQLIKSGIKGILNFTHIPLEVPSDVYLEEYDMITSLEKVAYFVKKKKK